jgi:ribosome-associated toxin RatA of RatAB toxin-antitoxin module
MMWEQWMTISLARRALCVAALKLGIQARKAVAGRWPDPLLRLAAALLVIAAGGAAAGTNSPDRVSVEARREGGAVIVEAHAWLRADLKVAWDVLTNYERYAEFIPDLKSSRIVARSGNTVIVEQKGQVGFFLFHFPMEVTMSVTEQPRTGIASHAIAGTFQEMTGSYTLVPDGDGLRLTYSGRMVPDFILPPLVGTAAVKAAVQKQFGALVKEMERRAAPGVRLQGP